MRRSFATFVALALALASVSSARANDELIRFKEYSFGIPSVQLKQRFALSCQRQAIDAGTKRADAERRMPERQRLQMFINQSGEIICTPSKQETVVGLPVTARFALFSDHLEQITLNFPRGPYDRFDFDWGKTAEMRTLVTGLTKRYGDHEVRKRRICPNGACGIVGSDEFTYIWRGRDGRITLTFLELPSVPATLTYTSLRFDSEQHRYEAEWRALEQQENERQAKIKTSEQARRSNDF